MPWLNVAVDILTPYAFAEASSVVFLSAVLLPALHTSLPAFALAPASNLQPRTTDTGVMKDATADLKRSLPLPNANRDEVRALVPCH